MDKANLRLLYNHAYDETKHYRSYEWQITVWSITLLAAISTIPDLLGKSLKFTPFVFWSLIVFSTFLCVTSILLIIHCHKSLTFNRIIIWKIEKHFGFFGVKLKHSEESLLPKKFKNNPPEYYRGIFHLFFRFLMIVLLTIYSIIQLSR
jgi:hypothetical protein